MKYTVGDKFILAGIECKVSLINVFGLAYLTPVNDGELYNGHKIYANCVFAVVDHKGKDKLGNKLYPVSNTRSGAV